MRVCTAFGSSYLWFCPAAYFSSRLQHLCSSYRPSLPSHSRLTHSPPPRLLVPRRTRWQVAKINDAVEEMLETTEYMTLARSFSMQAKFVCASPAIPLMLRRVPSSPQRCSRGQLPYIRPTFYGDLCSHTLQLATLQCARVLTCSPAQTAARLAALPTYSQLLLLLFAYTFYCCFLDLLSRWAWSLKRQ